DTGRQVRALFGGVAPVVPPESRTPFLSKQRLPGESNRRHGDVLLTGDRQVRVVDRRLHGGVVDEPVLWPAVAMRPGDKEDWLGTYPANHRHQRARGWIHLRLTEPVDRRGLALVLEGDAVPVRGCERRVWPRRPGVV